MGITSTWKYQVTFKLIVLKLERLWEQKKPVPYVNLELITPADYVGSLMELSTQRRGEFIDMTYLSEGRTCLKYEIPLGEDVTDFFDDLKSRSTGYASREYSFL